MNLYQVEKVSFSYQSVPVLEEVSFSVKAGEVFCVVGPNGAGKTTLLKILLGLLLPQTGRITYQNKEIQQYRQQNFPVGYLPQISVNAPMNSRLLLPVYDVVESGLPQSLNRSERKEKTQNALKLLHIEDLSARIFFKLSGGQQQKALLARALARNPETLILDEPSTGIDSDSKERLFDLLKTLNREKKMTLILVTHDLSVIPSLSHRVACLNRNLFVHENPAEFSSCPVMREEMASGLEILIHGTQTPHRTVCCHPEKGEKN